MRGGAAAVALREGIGGAGRYSAPPQPLEEGGGAPPPSSLGRGKMNPRVRVRVWVYLFRLGLIWTVHSIGRLQLLPCRAAGLLGHRMEDVKWTLTEKGNRETHRIDKGREYKLFYIRPKHRKEDFDSFSN